MSCSVSFDGVPLPKSNENLGVIFILLVAICTFNVASILTRIFCELQLTIIDLKSRPTPSTDQWHKLTHVGLVVYNF